jgi:hypothetical protein
VACVCATCVACVAAAYVAWRAWREWRVCMTCVAGVCACISVCGAWSVSLLCGAVAALCFSRERLMPPLNLPSFLSLSRRMRALRFTLLTAHPLISCWLAAGKALRKLHSGRSSCSSAVARWWFSSTCARTRPHATTNVRIEESRDATVMRGAPQTICEGREEGSPTKRVQALVAGQ